MFNNKTRKKKRHAGTDIISAKRYNLVMGLCLLYGFVVNAIMAWTMDEFFSKISPPAFIIGFFISGIIGAIIANASQKPVISFLGYNMILIPIGGMLSICLHEFEGADICAAMVVTGIVVVIMLVISTMKPEFFRKLGWPLFISLTLGIIVEFVAMLLGYGGNWINWLFVVIFSLYIGYDWCKAQEYRKTVDNAIDSAIDLYLDIINLFLRILSILSDDD